MSMKTVGELDRDDVASLGGAMSQWPRQPLNWICRDMRVNAADSNIARHLIKTNITRLEDLSNEVGKHGINTSGIDEKINSLKASDETEVMRAIQSAYMGKYEGQHTDCPFEQSGLDKACWRCPVAGNTYDILAEGNDG